MQHRRIVEIAAAVCNAPRGPGHPQPHATRMPQLARVEAVAFSLVGESNMRYRMGQQAMGRTRTCRPAAQGRRELPGGRADRPAPLRQDGPVAEGVPDASYQKAQVNRGERRQLWHCRDHAGLEVDFVLPGRGGALVAGLTAG
jgi:hypothetical protein